MVTVKFAICFHGGQFVGGAKNLQNKCAAAIYPPKSLSLLVNFEKFWSNAANCSEIFDIS